MIARALVLGVVLFAGPAVAQPALRPVDEASKHPAFAAFRDSLCAAIERHDVDAVLAAADSNIKLGFGGDDGIAVFEKQLRAPDTGVWRELAGTLALGGTFEAERRFVAPYVFSLWPDSLDAFEHVAITGSGVRVRARPSLRGEVLGARSYAIVSLAPGRGRPAMRGWTAVLRPGGGTGYVASRYVRSPVGYRAFFVPDGGSWKMTMFLAGD
ncbi:MAG: SH3 domain-containing protein [Candidatus Eisenbacteria bacterium]